MLIASAKPLQLFGDYLRKEKNQSVLPNYFLWSQTVESNLNNFFNLSLWTKFGGSWH